MTTDILESRKVTVVKKIAADALDLVKNNPYIELDDSSLAEISDILDPDCTFITAILLTFYIPGDEDAEDYCRVVFNCNKYDSEFKPVKAVAGEGNVYIVADVLPFDGEFGQYKHSPEQAAAYAALLDHVWRFVKRVQHYDYTADINPPVA